MSTDNEGLLCAVYPMMYGLMGLVSDKIMSIHSIYNPIDKIIQIHALTQSGAVWVRYLDENKGYDDMWHRL